MLIMIFLWFSLFYLRDRRCGRWNFMNCMSGFWVVLQWVMKFRLKNEWLIFQLIMGWSRNGNSKEAQGLLTQRFWEAFWMQEVENVSIQLFIPLKRAKLTQKVHKVGSLTTCSSKNLIPKNHRQKSPLIRTNPSISVPTQSAHATLAKKILK